MDPLARRRRATRRLLPVLTSLGLAAGLLAATSGVGVAAAGQPTDLTCSGGDFGTLSPEMIPSGTYGSISVTGFCEMAPGATITVRNAISVAPGAFLVASGALDNGMAYPDCDRTLSVGGGVTVGASGSLFLGDGPGSGCDTPTSTTIGGGLTADGALFLVVHGVTVNGSLTSVGGGDDAPCDWAGLPTYAAVEDSTVSGGLSVTGYRACWLGFARNRVNGGVTLANNYLDDPDAMEILDNTMNGGLACSGNTPTPTNIADGVDHEPNSVRGAESGQCAGL